MVNRALFVRSFVTAVLAALAAPALAQVNINGDVRPGPTGFGVVFIDDDADGFSDVISTEGNFNQPDLADPFDVTGMSGNGLAWNDPIIWNNYESQQNILVGETGAGELSIGGGSNLRFMHVVLGGVSEDIDTTSMYALDADANNAMYSLANAVADSDGSATGYGVMTVTGFGSLYSNDPQVLSISDHSALFFADEMNTTTPFDPTFEPINGDGVTPDTGPRDHDGAYDFYVGLSGGGELNVTAGGRVEIQDSLVVGLGVASTGIVNVDGSGSTLQVYGRTERDFMTGNSTQAVISGSIIGGNGVGALNVTDGGRANFANGLSIGDDNSGVGGIDLGSGSGTTIVTGAGSTLTAFASLSAVESADTSSLALAIGELRDTSTEYDPSVPLGAGTLEVGDGATVNATFDPSYSTTALDANAEIGRHGLLRMRGGSLRVDNRLASDGEIEGYGTIRAEQFVNTHLSTIHGDEVLGPLRMIIDSSEIDADMPEFAFTNLGTISGRVDITVAGGLWNGTNVSSTEINPGTTAGAIRASGRIESGIFFNRVEAEVHVGPGESLSILAVGDQSISDGAVIEGSGAPVTPLTRSVTPYSQANHGNINVNGGTLEVGRLLTSGPTTFPLDSSDKFRNARFRDASTNEETALGTITSDGGTIIFQSGLLNTGVVAFTGGDNVVRGEVMNSDEIDYDGDPLTTNSPGIILVSGDQTSVTFTDNVMNAGEITIGPIGTVANFLGDLDNTGGVLNVAVAGFGNQAPDSAAVVVAGSVTFNGGAIFVPFLTAGPGDTGIGIPLLTFGGELIVEGAPALTVDGLSAGQAAVLSVVGGQVNLAVVDNASGAFIAGDANGDGVVNAIDYTIYRDSAGTAVAAGTAGDFNGNGFVGSDDLATWKLNYGLDLSALPGPLTVPEPGAAALALLALSAVGRRR